MNILWIGIGICALVIIYLNLAPKQKYLVARRLSFRGRRPENTDTPPRSVSPEEKSIKDPDTTATEYVDSFPPFHRDLLENVTAALPLPQREQAGDLEFDENEFGKSLMKWEQDYRQANPSQYSPTGFSVREIKALGDFPDYAQLTGVPLPVAYSEHNVSKALPRPYRPFRWAYHQTMSLTKMEPDWWLEVENTYIERIAQRKTLYARHGQDLLQWLPGSELACKELMEMAIQFLCARYPQHFTLHSDRRTFENKILETIHDLYEKHPLLIMLDHIPEDFAIMLRHPDTGYYHFRAGIICSAIGWNLGTKISLRLHEIHEPVPDYKEKMKFSMDRFFSKMPASKPIQRGSWGIEIDQPLYHTPNEYDKPRQEQLPDLPLSRCHLRVDWQTLRRMPLSGAIVFNFKALFTPVEEFRDEPYIPSLILKVLREGKENIMKYKNVWPVQHVVVPALEDYAREQTQRGLMEKDWEVHTLHEAPFFPSWKDKWQRQQGF